MAYKILFEAVGEIFTKVDVSRVGEHPVFQFDITGEGQGIFYVEVKKGRLHVGPYEYYDRDVIFIYLVDTLLKLATEKLDPVSVFTTGKLKVEGSPEMALIPRKFI